MQYDFLLQRPMALRLFFFLSVTLCIIACSNAAVAQERDHFRQEFFRLKFDVDPALEGNCREGNCRHGRGRVALEDGGVYIGHFVEGLKHGTAVRIGPNGDRYLQVWENGVKKYDKRMGTLTSQVIDKKKERQGATNRKDRRGRHGKSQHSGTTSLR